MAARKTTATTTTAKPATRKRSTTKKTKVTISELMEFCGKDDVGTADIVAFFNKNNLVPVKYIQAQQIYNSANYVVEHTEFTDNTFKRNTFARTISATSEMFRLYVDIDYGEITVSNLYDFVMRYDLMDVLRQIIAPTAWDNSVNNICKMIETDFETYNNYLSTNLGVVISTVDKVSDSMSKLMESVNKNPELIDALANLNG